MASAEPVELPIPDYPIFVRRWLVIGREGGGLGCFVLHHWLMNDPFPLHDHGCFGMSVVLRGEFEEEYTSSLGPPKPRRRQLCAGHVVIRSPWAAHKFHIPAGRTVLTLYYGHPEFFRFRYWTGERWAAENTINREDFVHDNHH